MTYLRVLLYIQSLKMDLNSKIKHVPDHLYSLYSKAIIQFWNILMDGNSSLQYLHVLKCYFDTACQLCRATELH